MYGETDSHPSGYGQGNGGFSGTPLRKLKQQNHHQALVQAAQQAYLDEQEAAKAEKQKLDAEKEKSQRLIIDAVVHPVTNPRLARHVLVKDLRKVAGALNISLPTQGIFADGGCRSIVALFDSQGVSEPDAKAAETCCRQLPVTLLRNVSMVPAQNCIPAYVKAALLKTFEDLDLAVSGIGKRCAAAVAFVVGRWLFSAVLGRCIAVLFTQPRTSPDGLPPRHVATPLAAVCATLGPALPGAMVQTSPRENLSVPEVMGHKLDDGDDPFIIMTGSPVGTALSVQEILETGRHFLHRPRAACGEIVAKATDRLAAIDAAPDGGAAQPPACAAVAAFFREPDDEPGRKGETNSAKRPRVEAGNMESVRLRHIVVRHRECKFPVDPLKNKAATRTPMEAETLLRETLAELLKDGNHRGDSKWAAQSTPRIMKTIQDISECKSALKGGSQRGDLGWLGKKDLERLGTKEGFADPIRALSVGEWSDVLHSEQGAHLIMRIA